MRHFGKLTASIIVTAGISLASTASAENFDWIMGSVSKAGSLENGDGHYWEFRGGKGKWEVEAPTGDVASVTASGADKVKLDGFPDDWGANGGFAFSRADGKCKLKSDHSGHEVEWKC